MRYASIQEVAVNIEPVCGEKIAVKRRRILQAGIAGLSMPWFHRAAAGGRRTLIGTTPVFLDDQLGFLDQWRVYLESRLGSSVAFVQRSNYREVTDLLLEGAIDCAWLCGYPFVRHRNRLQLVVTPTFKGAPLYESYMIVAAERKESIDLQGMKGQAFAFSDPLSNSGYLVPRYTLWSKGIDPDRHFRRTLFTLSHKKVVQAVAVGLVDGGSVDGYVWETLARTNPDLTGQTRVAWKSQTFGFPPIVASKSMAVEKLARLQRAFIGMRQDSDGQALLAKLNLDGFVVTENRLFDPIEQMMHSLAGAGKAV
jgi:phosphonate transport system substrate-binding protein